MLRAGCIDILVREYVCSDYDYGDQLVIKERGRSCEEVPLWRRGRQGITLEEKEALNILMTWAVCKSEMVKFFTNKLIYVDMYAP